MKTKMPRQIRFCLFIYGRNNLTGYSFLLYFTLLLESLGEITMGEAFIWYRGRNSVDPELLKPTVIIQNMNYNAPVSGTYQVWVVGGGGGGAGSCRNAWNTSQVMYGPAGNTGTMYQTNVALNQGQSVQCTLGAGGSAGTNNTSPLSYSNGQVNSVGGSGTSGGTSSFGTVLSSAGGAGGSYPWYNKYWSNINYGWVNTIYTWRWNNTYNNRTWVASYLSSLSSTYQYWYRYDVIGAMAQSDSNNIMNTYPNHSNQVSIYHSPKIVWQNLYGYQRSGNIYLGSPQCIYLSENASYMGMSGYVNYTMNRHEAAEQDDSQFGYHHGVGYMTYINTTWNFQRSVYEPVWSNYINWNNRILNSTGRCYTSVQQSSVKWYVSGSILSTFSGNRTYYGDGGNSGQKGNSGFILIVPPQS